MNYGYKYTYSNQVERNSNLKEGVFFSKLSNKWRVQVFNQSISKTCRPIVSIAQFENKKDAEKYFKEFKKINYEKHTDITNK